ncbi:outer membrane protein assembly factor BamB family protein [Cellulomonas humilata]|uniref:Outer membrane protein assembly factor BamB n=1 Tax=Cellulomonas humilata TaxID=144055 RepID=A0ABU0EIK4_9CELL|nr:PQQ-binding-like beta-propeller repeat protein [Cellulomonas humilata]MDQ0375106.1 outer membrane protein assembly factor BamB [Cellulomonas humilata]
MGPTRRMQQVEVVDDDHLIAAADGPRTSGRVRRWVAVLLVVTLVLAGAQLVLAARDRATSARFAQLPGALPPVDADVGALWRVDEADLEVLTEGVEVEGGLLGVRTGGDGAASVVSLDPRTGAERWSTPLTDADTVLAQRGARSSVTSCLQVPEADDAEPLVACLVSDALLSFGIRGRLTVTRPPTTSRVVVVDAADGRVVADRTAPPAIAFAVLPGLVAVGLPGHDGHAEVTAQDLLSGEVLWHHSSPRPAVDPVGDVSGFEVVALDDLVAVVEVGSNVTLLAADGTVARERERYDRLSQDEAATRLEVLSGYLAFKPVTTIVQPGRADRRIPGRLVTRTVDDGSLPGIELIEGSRMQARDATTGDRLWQADRHTSGPVLVLRGLVYCTSGDSPGELVAFDGRSGSVVWSANVGTYDQLARLMTDGRVLLVGLTPAEGEAEGSLAAFALADGERLWRVPLPDGLDAAWTLGHVLVAGDDADPTVSVVLGSP